MTILDMSKFVKEFEERYGVTAAAPVAVAAAAPGAAALQLRSRPALTLSLLLSVTRRYR